MAGAAQAQTAADLDGEGRLTAAQSHPYTNVFLEGDSFTAAYTFSPRAADVGKNASIHVAAKADGKWFALVGAEWRAWNGRLESLPASDVRVLSDSEAVPVLQNQALFAGDYDIYVGYRPAGGGMVYASEPFSFTIASANADALQRVGSNDALERHLKESMLKSASREYYSRAFNVPDLVATANGSGAERTSTTNLQESGVDEADSIKVSGDTLFLLKHCEEKTCLDVQRLEAQTAAVEAIGSYTFDSKQAPDGMYLVDGGIGGQKHLVTVAGLNQFWGWFTLWGGWHDGKTELEFLNVANPAKITRTEKLTLDGVLVASRRVGNTLHVVTRYTPFVDGFRPYAMDKAEEVRNAELLAGTTLPELLPRIETRDKVETLVKSMDCYLPTKTADGSSNPSIITITSIQLDAPGSRKSTCFLGASETLYVSSESLYLATTATEYDILATGDLRYTPDHTTAIHKFALTSTGIDYRGSGEVKGHLGWVEDKKSFRMGEHDGYLNVATSIGDTWGGDSSTRLSVLKEIGGGKLATVKTIDGIGKPGEQLYAARFVGDRAYLVTFRVIDPLYVVDLSRQENPRIVGELEIAGYSDYLHPVSETLVLGVGKDAVPAEESDDFGGGRGAWYQGLKLALFDVSDPASPEELDTVVLGKRGTDSEALWDHHAVTWLPGSGSEPGRLAIPVQLHDKPAAWSGIDPNSPRAWYDHTHTGLYSFDVDAKGITQVGRIIAEVGSGNGGIGLPRPRVAVDATGSLAILPYRKYYGDRAVLSGDAVYYIHQGKVLSSMWGQNKTP